jgi:hypothetical protein
MKPLGRFLLALSVPVSISAVAFFGFAVTSACQPYDVIAGIDPETRIVRLRLGAWNGRREVLLWEIKPQGKATARAAFDIGPDFGDGSYRAVYSLQGDDKEYEVQAGYISGREFAEDVWLWIGRDTVVIRSVPQYTGPEWLNTLRFGLSMLRCLGREQTPPIRAE